MISKQLYMYMILEIGLLEIGTYVRSLKLIKSSFEKSMVPNAQWFNGCKMRMYMKLVQALCIPIVQFYHRHQLHSLSYQELISVTNTRIIPLSNIMITQSILWKQLGTELYYNAHNT